jgi:hypothetical protein
MVMRERGLKIKFQKGVDKPEIDDIMASETEIETKRLTHL